MVQTKKEGDKQTLLNFHAMVLKQVPFDFLFFDGNQRSFHNLLGAGGVINEWH